jgi:hypothetical protein
MASVLRWRGLTVARVACVHGIGQQRKGPVELRAEWFPALADGLILSGSDAAGLKASDVDCAFYGNVFRPAGRLLGPDDPWLTAADVNEFEVELATEWWQGAAKSDGGVIDPGARSLAGVPGGVQAALRALSGSVFFTGVAERAMLWDLRQVRLYMTDDQVRGQVQDRVAAAVTADTVVMVGHSLVLQHDFVIFMFAGLAVGSGWFGRGAGGVAARWTSSAGAEGGGLAR